MNDYLTFDQAAEFLSTPRSTLYRWLREGKVPGHKLGRQWRFLRSELDEFRAGGTRSDEERQALAQVRALVGGSSGHNRGAPMRSTHPAATARDLVWHAVDEGAYVIHLQPSGDDYRLQYRTSEGLKAMLPLPREAFEALDREWTAASHAIRDDSKRRLFFERQHEGEPDRLQVRYQKLATLGGDRVTLKVWRENRFHPSIDLIAPDAEDAATLRRWAGRSHGLVLLSGRAGSGKTTTAYACLSELAGSGDRVIFTLEDQIGFYLPGVGQVEVDLDDERAMRDAFSAVMDSDLDALFISTTMAQRHLRTLYGLALGVAESGHLVFVQLEAESAADAVARVVEACDRPIEPTLVGAVWQELLCKDTGGRRARYEFQPGDLDPGQSTP